MSRRREQVDKADRQRDKRNLDRKRSRWEDERNERGPKWPSAFWNISQPKESTEQQATYHQTASDRQVSGQ